MSSIGNYLNSQFEWAFGPRFPPVSYPDVVALEEEKQSALRSLVDGDFVKTIHFFSNPPTAGYVAAREKPMIAGGHTDFPYAIAKPATFEEVAAIVKCCASNCIDTSVHAGGHSTVGMKGSVVIHMGNLNNVSVDADGDTPIVTIGGGCSNGDVDAACMPHGVACTLGNAGSVGAISAMMGGGVGYLARWQGLTIDNLVDTTVVLADGRVVTAEKGGKHGDLFFALKGAGANFGVVVEAKVKAGRLDFDPDPTKKGFLYSEQRVVRHSNGPFTIFANGMGEKEVFKAWRDYSLTAPDCVSCDCLLPTNGPMIQIYTYKGSYEDAKVESKKWKLLGRAAVTDGKAKSYHGNVQAEIGKHIKKDAPMPHSWRIAIMDSLPDEAVEALMHASNAGRANDISLIHVERLGGKIDSPDDGEDACAFAHRGGKFWISMIGIYSTKGKHHTAEEDAKVDAWLETLYNALKPYAIGEAGTGTVGYANKKTGEQVKENSCGSAKSSNEAKAKVRRIVAIKKKYDPKNFFKNVENGFCHAVNIDPNWSV